MSRNEEFSQGHGFTFRVEDQDVIPSDHALVVAQNHQGKEIGFMELGPNREEGRRVMDIQVNEDHRRRGVATGLWNHAKERGMNPVHSSMRTHAGDQWAKSVGDYYTPSEIV